MTGRQAGWAALALGLAMTLMGHSEETIDPLAAWKRALARAGVGDQTLTVLLIGDSNTEMNGYAPALRAILQGCYGDAGVGYQPFGRRMQDIPGAAVLVKKGNWIELDFAIDPAQPAPPKPWFALDGLWIRTDQPDATISVTHSAPSLMRLYYQTGPELGSFRISFPGTAQAALPIACQTQAPGVAAVDFQATAFQVDGIRGPVVLLGFDSRRPGLKGGAVVHQLGNGFGMVHHYAAIEEAAWRLFLAHAGPDLIVIMLGTNDMNNGWYADEYRAELARLIETLRAQAPGASIVLVGCASCTFDRMRFADAFARTAAELAREKGCRFWDLNAEVGEHWRHWDRLGLMEYTLHYLPPNGQQLALRLLRAVGFNPLDPAHCPTWRDPAVLLPSNTPPAQVSPREGWPQRPDRPPRKP